MSDIFMRCTSISHCATSNFQVDYAGSKQNCINYFVDWCAAHEAIWANLSEEKTGELIATYSKDSGVCVVTDKERIAELERKLAAYQAWCIAKNGDDVNNMLAPPEELNTLLAKAKEEGYQECHDEWMKGCVIKKAKEEGRREAVPEGWQLVPKEPTEAMVMSVLQKHRNPAQWVSDRSRIYKTMLASAPKPQGATK